MHGMDTLNLIRPNIGSMVRSYRRLSEAVDRSLLCVPNADSLLSPKYGLILLGIVNTKSEANSLLSWNA